MPQETNGMIEKKIPSALPIYLAAGAFLVCSLFLPIYQMWAIVVAGVVSGVTGMVAHKKIPPRTVLVPAPEPVYRTGSQELDALLGDAQKNLKALHDLNVRIPDAALSASIERMETAGASILREIGDAPDKARSVRKFLTHYIPTAVKVLSTYADLAAAGASGENARALTQQVEQNAQIIAKAFESQLDCLFAGEVLDVSTDLDVLEAMAKSDGLVKESDSDEQHRPGLQL